MKRACFFDRDGVLNELVSRDGGEYSPRTLLTFSIFHDSIDVTRRTSDLGFVNIIISNQPDISRGKLDCSILRQMTDILLSKLVIDDVFYCIHDDHDNCSCRKPLPGLIYRAKRKWDIDLNESFLVGDTWNDIEAARVSGLDSFLLDREYNENVFGVKRISNLSEIFKYIG